MLIRRDTEPRARAQLANLRIQPARQPTQSYIKENAGKTSPTPATPASPDSDDQLTLPMHQTVPQHRCANKPTTPPAVTVPNSAAKTVNDEDEESRGPP